MTQYDLAFLATDGWKKYKVETDKTPEQVQEYVSSPYTKKVHIEEAKTHDRFGYMELEKVITEHPHYPIPNDKALNYFKNTKHDYLNAEVFEIRKDNAEIERKKREAEKLGRGLFGKLF